MSELAALAVYVPFIVGGVLVVAGIMVFIGCIKLYYHVQAIARGIKRLVEIAEKD